jgi:hypothetical protein
MVSTETDQMWVKTKWRSAQLDQEAIEFRISLDEIGIVDGIGYLSAHPRSADDLLSVQIVVKEPTGLGLHQRQTVIVLSEEYVAAIKPHPNQGVAHFRLKTA